MSTSRPASCKRNTAEHDAAMVPPAPAWARSARIACAIPSLFGYNYLNSQITTITNEMRVFVDRLVTRLAEIQADAAEPPPMKMAAE